ncbi:hypothetical protein WICPIJ_006209, partial [Wickerhamomyces pijperi]
PCSFHSESISQGASFNPVFQAPLRDYNHFGDVTLIVSSSHSDHDGPVLFGDSTFRSRSSENDEQNYHDNPESVPNHNK